MVEEWKTKDVDTRFGTYVEELRDFFASRKIPSGSPTDLATLTGEIASSPAFAEEMGSMVRSIVFSEGEHMRRGDLWALVAVASGGPAVDAQQEGVAGAALALQHFLDTATRQQWAMFASGDDQPEGHEAADPESSVVTASQILASEPLVEEHPPLWERAEASFLKEAAPPEVEAADTASPSTPHSNEVLSRAVRMAAAQKTQPPRKSGWRATLGQWWSIPAAGLALAAIAVGVHVGRLQWTHENPAATPPGLLSNAGGSELAGSCVASPGPGISRSGLEERSHWAHSLLEQKLYAVALPELRTIAHLDPGYPAIQLDESDALLNLRRPDEAREAVDEQIKVAECLAKLPGPALDAYCTVQYGPAVLGACRPQLEHIRQAAQLQAALVHLELGHRIASTGGTAAAVAELKRSEAAANPTPSPAAAPLPEATRQAAPRLKPKAPLPPASEEDTAQPAVTQPGAGPR